MLGGITVAENIMRPTSRAKYLSELLMIQFDMVCLEMLTPFRINSCSIRLRGVEFTYFTLRMDASKDGATMLLRKISFGRSPRRNSSHCMDFHGPRLRLLGIFVIKRICLIEERQLPFHRLHRLRFPSKTMLVRDPYALWASRYSHSRHPAVPTSPE